MTNVWPYTVPQTELKKYSSLVYTKLLLSSISEYYTEWQLGHELLRFINLNSEQEKENSICLQEVTTYKSLARPGRKQATATEDFDVHISYLLS